MGKLSKRDKYIIAGCSLFGIIFIIWFIFVTFEIGKPKPDYNKFAKAIVYYIENNDAIDNIIIKDDDFLKVIVNDSWYYASEKDKLKFCINVRKAMWVYANQCNLISEKDNIYLYFYDNDGIKLTEQKLNEFTILH